jgi:eukaryotic-like serine/threonine-protein kinase
MQSNHPEARGVGRYIIHSELASGGMAAVYLGQLLGQAGFSRAVAIKRLHEHLAKEPEFVAMLIDEAKLVASIHHPNVVSTLDIVCENDDLLIVMDYVEGETLAALLREAGKGAPRRPATRAEVSRIVLDVLAGLHAAHIAKTHTGDPLNIVHRDVSPQNIMVGVDGVARVLDFGVAKAERRHHSTRPGHIKGKFAYMSPEQVRGSRVDARTDVFATGIVLWECLTGQRLFPQHEKERGIERVLTMPIPRPSTHEKTLSRDIDEVVMRALARDPSARYGSAADFAQALHAAIPPACPSEVSRWVTDVAKGSIVGHARLLRELELSTVPDHPMSGRALSLVGVPAVGARAPRLRAGTTDMATVPTGPPGFEPGRGLVVPTRSRRSLWIALGAVSLCVLAALRIGSPGPRIPEGPEGTSPHGRSASHPVGARFEGAEATGAIRPEDVPTPPVPAAALPLEPAAIATPQSFAVRVPSEPPARAPSSRNDSARVSRNPGRRPSAPVPPKSGALAAPAPSRAPAVTRAPAPECDLPYRIDAFGVRRVRRECL